MGNVLPLSLIALITNCQSGVWKSQTTLNTVIHSAVGTGVRFSSATAYCNANERLIAGGANCHSTKGWVYINQSAPSGNGWFAGCDTSTDSRQNTTTTAWAICSVN